MKRAIIFVFAFLFVVLISQNVLADGSQVLQLRDEVSISGTQSTVKELITFQNFTGNFTRNIIANVQNFNYTFLGGTGSCSLSYSGLSQIFCTGTPSTSLAIQFNYQTNDYVRSTGNSQYIFSADFSIGQTVPTSILIVTLPEGAIVVLKDGAPVLESFPNNVTARSDGQHIILAWELLNSDALQINVLYQQIQSFINPTYLVVLILAVVFGAAFVVYYLSRKRTEKIIFNVLDPIERQILDEIIKAGDEVNQKQIVLKTNLSKAKVSKVVKSLEQRGLIEVKHLGRTNKLKYLRKRQEE